MKACKHWGAPLGWRVRPWLKGSLGLVLVFMLAAPAMAGPYAHAKNDGAMNFSYGCPPHSAWNPRGGGQCLSCPGGTLVGAGCQRWVTPRYQHANKVAKHGLFCPKGTYTALTGCYRCPKGMQHDFYMALESAKACRRGRAPHFESYPAKIVKRVSMQQLLDPRKFGSNISKLGCKAYGRGAFFDAGTCWSCPSSHPQRTPFPHPIYGPKACTTRVCGQVNGRPCYLWERVPSCNKGLTENPLTNTCVSAPNLGCQAMVDTTRTLINALREAEKAGKVLSPDQLGKIPGLNALVSFANNQINQVSGQAMKLLKGVPVEQVTASLKRAFPTPEVAAQVSRVLAGIQNRRAEIQAAMLDAGSTCSANPTRLKRIFSDIVRTATAQANTSAWGNLLGIANANAGVRNPLAGWSFGVTIEGAFTLSKIPTQIGLEVEMQITETGDVEVSPMFAVGIDILKLGKIKIEPPHVDVFAFVAWPRHGVPLLQVGRVSAGVGLLAGNRFGFGFDRGRDLLKSISVRLGPNEKKPSIPAIAITDPEGKTVWLSEAEGTLKSGLSSAQHKGKGGKLLKKELTFGPDIELNLSLTHQDATGSYAY